MYGRKGTLATTDRCKIDPAQVRPPVGDYEYGSGVLLPQCSPALHIRPETEMALRSAVTKTKDCNSLSWQQRRSVRLFCNGSGCPANQFDTIPYSQFEQLVAEGSVTEVTVGPDTIQGKVKDKLPSWKVGLCNRPRRCGARRKTGGKRRRGDWCAVGRAVAKHPGRGSCPH